MSENPNKTMYAILSDVLLPDPDGQMKFQNAIQIGNTIITEDEIKQLKDLLSCAVAEQ